MRLVTFQDKYVLDKLEFEQEEGRPPAFFNTKLYFQDREMNIVNKLINEMKTQLKIPMERRMIPIWCWVVPKNMELLKPDIEELYNRHIPSCKEMIFLDLIVPDDGIFITNYDIWYDILLDMKFSRHISEEGFQKLFEKKKGATLQACIPFIHKSFIKNVTYFDRYIDREYFKTEKELKDMIDNDLITLDNNGNIWEFKEKDYIIDNE